MWVSEIYFQICGDDVVKTGMMWQVTWPNRAMWQVSWLNQDKINSQIHKNWRIYYIWTILQLMGDRFGTQNCYLCQVNFTNTWVLYLNLKSFYICNDDVVVTWQMTWPNCVTWPNRGTPVKIDDIATFDPLYTWSLLHLRLEINFYVGWTFVQC